jgi:hypothetical protein
MAASDRRLRPDAGQSIEHPQFDDVRSAVERSGRADPVVVLVEGAEARAYPLRILLWHEAVNDVVAGRPLAITYSPLSDGAAVFDRRVDGRTLTFGSSGKLFRASLVLYDEETVSLWPQPAARSIAGPLKGRTLTRVAAPVTSLGAFADAVPNGRVLADRTGFTRAYTRTPYAAYDGRPRPSRSFFLRPIDPRLDPMHRVAGVTAGGRTVAYPFEAVAGAGVLNDGDLAMVWVPQVRSVLDEAEIARSRLVGSVVGFRRVLDGRTLTLRALGQGGMRDQETGTTWNALGRATGGPLAGRSLVPAETSAMLWFAWAAFNPSTFVAASR